MNLNSSHAFFERWYQKLSSGKVVVVSGIIYIISQAFILAILSCLGHDPLTLQTTFSKTVFTGILEKWGQSGLHIYKTHFYVDFVHAFIYAVFLSSWIAYLTVKPGKKPAPLHLVLWALPFIAGLCDVIENIFHLVLISNPADISGTLIKVSAAFANTKWGLARISLVAIVFYALRRGYQGRKKKLLS